MHLEADNLLRQALARRPDLAKVEIGVKVAAREQQLARAAYCPDVGAFASFSNVWDDGHFANPTHPNEGTVGVGVQIPLFVGGRRIAESHQADFQQARATQVRRLLASLVSQEVRDAYLEYLESSEELEKDKEAVSQSFQAMQQIKNPQQLQKILDEVRPEERTAVSRRIDGSKVLRGQGCHAAYANSGPCQILPTCV